ncbi:MULTISPECIES: hypothetical protein [Microbulbifer]|uniref:hypothetical protein n=1 Tax=Microbulbifer TaxID=48073 RepID=UPI001E29285D|nr:MULTISPECIES: hypothetical protein [Microbulbifer]UHQ55007.1 hypothetical protein LVE68_16085 [Microbulbifer sp. YPW16]
MKRVARLVAYSLAVICAIYGALIVVNLRDVPPGPEAERLRALLDERPEIADADNAFVFASGFEIARGYSPVEWGRKRLNWIAAAGERGAAGPDHPPGEYYSRSRDRAAAHAEIAQSHMAAMTSPDSELASWIDSERWLLERYRLLVALPAWRGVVPENASIPFVPFQSIMDGQKMLMSEARLAAGRGDAARVRAMLQQDLRFWRLLLGESDLLITKMIAAAAIRRHFESGNVVLARLARAGGAGGEGVPESWRDPFGDSELSMSRVMAGEWRYGSNLITLMLSERDLADPLKLLARPLFQVQDSMNRHARKVVAWIDYLDVPLSQLPGRVAAGPLELAGDDGLRAYNLTGWLLEHDWGYPNYTDYRVRVADLEGARRAVLRATYLRDGNAVRVPGLRDPYTGAALTEAGGAVEFVGLAGGDRGRFRFPI